MNIEERAYAAGIFDGEGCIGLYNRAPAGKTKNFGPNITIAQKSDSVLFWLQERWNGKVYYKTNPTYCGFWTIYKEWYIFLTDIQPYVIVKKTQVDYMLAQERPFREDVAVELARLKKAYR